MPQHPEHEIEVFNTAVELPAADRTAYLDQACAGDAVLRQRVEDLVKSTEDAGGFLENPSTASRAETGRVPATPAGKPGDRIGRYKLLQQIGEGGCGVVYMAEQEEPVRRKVALKVIKLGMDTKSVIARFEAERQALALMDHPNIARVLDAGATQTGRPYFVMELVHGTRITNHCDENNLDTRSRLGLFIQVCQAIQHAHQKGIIHRDIKPSNILITMRDGVPVPKVIDFGIAKATTGEKLTDKTLFTQFAMFIGTPAYMSPEQAEMSELGIDTRSDIYSLGVLLYELLTGQTPFDSRKLQEASLDEMRRVIRRDEPPRPSTRLSTMAAASLTEVARHRQAEPARLRRLIHGELDWIVMRALEKDRARRYETANGLAADLQRYLRNEPVVAGPPSSLYQFRKLVRRHQLLFAAASAVVASLVAGLGVSTWLLVKERQARHDADAARAAEAVFQRDKGNTDTIREALAVYVGGDFAGAEKVLNSIPSASVQPDSLHANLRRNLGWWHALQEQPKEAIDNLATLMELDGLDGWDAISMDFLLYGTQLAALPDKSRYEDLRQAALARFLNTTNPAIAERICRLSLLLPAGENVMRQVVSLCEVARRGPGDAGVDQYDRNWAGLSPALLDYRQGNYPGAIEQCRQSLTYSLKNPLGITTGEVDHQRDFSSSTHPLKNPLATAAVLTILAMAHHQLHQDNDAASALEEAGETNDEQYFGLINVHVEVPGRLAELFDGLEEHLLLREADQLIAARALDADPGYAGAQYSLGLMYSRGEGVTRDLAQAAKWYTKAAAQGQHQAQVNLGVMYERGEGVPRDADEAIRLFRLAGQRISSAGCDGPVCVTPQPPVAGAPITIQYSAREGPLAAAKQILIHLGWNNWDMIALSDAAMTSNAVSKRWEYTVNVPAPAILLDCCFTDGAGAWDNYYSANWAFAVATNGMTQASVAP